MAKGYSELEQRYGVGAAYALLRELERVAGIIPADGVDPEQRYAAVMVDQLQPLAA